MTYTWTDNIMRSGTTRNDDGVADNLMHLKYENASTLDRKTPYSVVSGAIDANGYPSFITKIDNSTVTIQATATNTVVFYPNGNIESITVDQNVGSIADSTTTIFVKEKDNNTVQKATSVTESLIPPLGGNDGDYWLNIGVRPCIPYKKISGTWTVIQFVKLGEATKTSGTLSTPISYAFNSIYDSGNFDTTSGNNVTKNHNIGSSKLIATLFESDIQVYKNITLDRNTITWNSGCTGKSRVCVERSF